MEIILKIPDSIVQAIKFPEKRVKQELLLELAVGLYSQDLISFSKARDLSGKDRFEFSRILSKRGINRHLDLEDLKDDFDYAHCK